MELDHYHYMGIYLLRFEYKIINHLGNKNLTFQSLVIQLLEVQISHFLKEFIILIFLRISMIIYIEQVGLDESGRKVRLLVIILIRKKSWLRLFSNPMISSYLRLVLVRQRNLVLSKNIIHWINLKIKFQLNILMHINKLNLSRRNQNLDQNLKKQKDLNLYQILTSRNLKLLKKKFKKLKKFKEAINE